MSVYPRKTKDWTNGYGLPEDWDAMVDRVNGFTPEGTFVSPYSYLISTDGTYYYASNAFQTVYGGPNKAGGVDGTDASAVIQATINNVNANGGGIICVNPSSYLITSKIILKKNVELVGSGTAYISGAGVSNKTIFIQMANLDYMFSLDLTGEPNDDADVVLRDFSMFGNRGGGYTGSGLLLKNCDRVRLENVRITYFSGSAITLDNTEFDTFRDIYIDQCLGYGFYVSSVAGEIQVERSVIVFCSYGWFSNTQPLSTIRFVSNDIYLNTNHAIYIANNGAVSSQEIFFTLNNIHDNGADGILLSGAVTNVKVDLNRIYNNGAIGLQTTAITTYYPTIDITNNVIVENVVSQINLEAGTIAKLENNRGYVTENSGTDTIDDYHQKTFPHGLAKTPTHVSVSFKDSTEQGAWYWTASTESITVIVANTGSYSFSWHAEYQP